MKRPRMARRLFISLTVLAIGAALCLEVGFRLIAESNADGERMVRGRRILPYRLPAEQTRYLLEQDLPGKSCLQYDSLLGWSPKPGCGSINEQGIKGASEYDKTPPDGVLRIAMFGACTVEGFLLPPDSTIPHYLEAYLKAGGVHAEVMNFGCGGYGVDQAYLRWTRDASRFAPALVFCWPSRETLDNLIRPVFHPGTGQPFSKPRFVIDADSLRIINVPTLRPEKIPSVLEDFNRWNLAQFEGSYLPANYRKKWWMTSTIFSYKYGKPVKRKAMLDYERDRIFWMLIERFANSVKTSGAKFVLVGDDPYSDSGNRMADSYNCVWTGKAILEARRDGVPLRHSLDPGHYGGEASRVLARCLFEFITTDSQMQGLRHDFGIDARALAGLEVKRLYDLKRIRER